MSRTNSGRDISRYENTIPATIEIIKGLVEKGAIVCAYDPVAENEAKHYFEDKIQYVSTKEDALKENECLLILTDWDEFKQPDYVELKKTGIKVIFDGKNFLEPTEIKKHGLEYIGIGRK